MKSVINTAIIPAWGGSKSIPRKNLEKIGGKPLVAWPIETALGVRGIDKVLVSTEDEEIAQVSRKWGAEVIKRPKKLAQNETPTLPVLQHAVGEIEKSGDRVGIILLLYPTSPFLRADRLVEALDIFAKKKVNSILGVRTHWKTLWRKKGEGLERIFPQKRVNRQYIEPLYMEAGEIFFSRRKVIMEMKRMVDPNSVELLEIEGEEELLEIDEREDLFEARRWLMNARRRGYGR